jgi:hypothetical protein
MDTSGSRSEIPEEFRNVGAGEGWKRSVGPIVLKIKKCYTESIRKEVPYVQ